MKFKRVAGDCLAAFAEATSFGFVLGHVYEPLKKQKAPKVIADGLAWIQQTLIDFGATGIKISEMLDCVKVCLGNTNAAVRNAAVVLLGALRIYVGPEIRGLLNDLNSALLSVIDAEFEKCADKKPVAPTKFSKKSSASSPASSSVTNGSSGVNGALAVDENEDMLDDICPRVDISTSITDTLIEELGHTQWKIRKEALDNMVMILDGANKRIKSNLGSEYRGELELNLSFFLVV